MSFENIEAAGLQTERIDGAAALGSLKGSFDSSVASVDGVYQNFNDSIESNMAQIVGIDAAAMNRLMPEAMESARKMLDGVDIDGVKTLGLEELSKHKLNPEYFRQNLKQQSGFAAEIVSTWKENLIAKAEGTGITTVRADDLPELFAKNDQLVDKVRLDSNGNIVETIQTKFVGKNGSEWVSKMMSSKFDKYFDGAVDKLECPKDHYEEAMATISEKKAGLQNQLEHVLADGKTEAVEKISRQIDKYSQLEKMTEQSTVTSGEAQFARLFPKAYVAKTFATEVSKVANMEGLKTGGFAAAITLTTSSVEHVSAFLNNEISAEQMVTGIAGDTVMAGAIGYGSAFAGTAISTVMSQSSSALIQTVGGTCAPAAVVSFAVESAGDIYNYAQGNIETGEFAYNLGDHAAAVAGSVGGMVATGAIMGTALGPVGTAAGAVVGGVVGTVVATGVYEAAVELGSDGAEVLGGKAQELANYTIDAAAECVPEKVNEIKAAFNDFFHSDDFVFDA